MDRKKFLFFTLTAIFIAPQILVSGGCAFGDRVVALRYHSEIDVNQKQVDSQEIYIASFKDVSSNNLKKISFKDSKGTRIRTDGKEIGEIRNGYNIKTACVVSKSPDLGPWITHALSQELKQRGFNVINVTSLPPEISLGINGSIEKCYSKMYFLKAPDCTIQATISLQKSGVTVFAKEYIGQSKVSMGIGAKGYEIAFQEAMKDLLDKSVPDIMEACQ
ncbi:MAG: hypothetical protein KAQ89_05395 [Planctomycetes bacterium]|nr:hypothetical protein [Planctomycetota bacterium]